ncbi:tetratricopeptide repeat protein [Candidatus Woesearchaeota archaeon]|nr:tetratricopeptide repeat protein [Candidatus Woesearchaeota archaeon]
MNDLERRVIAGFRKNQLDIEEALLVFSGVDNQKDLDNYREKIRQIYQGFCDTHSPFSLGLGTARNLYAYLWKHEGRHTLKEYRLTTAIDRYIEDAPPYGNCVALTSLYTVVGLRLGLNLFVALSPDHIISGFKTETKRVYIENGYHKDSPGFDIPLHTGFVEHDLPALVASLLAWVVNRYCDDGKLTAALEYSDFGTELAPRLGIAYCKKAQVLALLGNEKDAYQHYMLAVEYHYRNDFVFRKLGDIHAGEGNYGAAAYAYTQAISHAQKDPGLYIRRAQFFLNLGEPKKALEDCTTAIGIFPQTSSYYILRGDCYLESKEYNLALDDYRKALELRPGDAAAVNGIGNCYFYLGDLKNAYEYYDALTCHMNQFAYAYAKKAEILEKWGMLSDARAALEKAVIINPDYQRDLELFNACDEIF